MRVKISFLREQNSSNSIPLHHQKLLAVSLQEFVDPITSDKSMFNFSSLKGTTKIQNGFMRILSTKVTLVISGPNKEFVEQLVHSIFTRPFISVGKMNLVPKSFEIIPDPEFNTKMRYLCISPLILADPRLEPEKSQEQIDPSSQAFSDILYNHLLDRMEKAGFPEDKLNDFAEFEASPDKDYVAKINETGKKYARYYKCMDGHSMLGYLLPFTLHAHPDVHKFIWECGMGVLNEQGYGMIDTVK